MVSDPRTQKEYNRQVNSYQTVIERGIAHLKNGHILETKYRRPIKDFANVIHAIVGMMFHNGIRISLNQFNSIEDMPLDS